MEEPALLAIAPNPLGHPSAADIERFFLSPALPSVGCEVARHLLDACAICREEAVALWDRAVSEDEPLPSDALAPSTGAGSFDAMWSRLLSLAGEAKARLQIERDDARPMLARFLRLPPERQLLLVANSRRHRSWGLCELLLEEAWAQRFKHPRRTESLARVAVEVSKRLPVDRYGREPTHDLQARCWIGLSNGLRILGDYAAAAAALEEARRRLAEGTGDPLDRALWLDIRASLAIGRGQLETADHCIGLATRTYFLSGQRHALGSALIKRAAISLKLHEVERAVAFGEAGLELVDAERDASVLLGGWLNLIRALHSLGRHRAALAALASARPVYAASSDHTTILRFQWLEGSIALALGRDEQAEGCLRETRDGFLQLGIAHDAAIVSLDLASLLARQSRNAEVCHLAAEMIAIFESRESKTEALAALILLRQAAEREHVTEALVQRLRGSLQDARAEG